MKRFSRKRIWLAISFVIILLLIFILFWKTGFLQKNSIDDRDLEAWDYVDGVIVGSEAFWLDGGNETCWYLIHGYTSTPAEMKGIAGSLHAEFGDTVFVTRLWGNGEVPSHILNLTLFDWYSQVSGEFDELEERCDEVNLVGFSFGGALSARLAEERDVNNLYLLAPYLVATYDFYHGLRSETYLNLFSDLFLYTKKRKIGQINSEEGLENHVAYWNMPLTPIKYSKEFFEEVKINLGKIDEPVLLQHSKKDKASDMDSSVLIYDGVSSEVKELIVFEKSNHILPADYDKEDVVLNIIDFEKRMREE